MSLHLRLADNQSLAERGVICLSLKMIQHPDAA